MGPAAFAQAGAALAVFIKSRDKQFRTLSLSASISALFGVTEPAMFGVNLPLRKPMVIVCIAGSIGGGWLERLARLRSRLLFRDWLRCLLISGTGSADS